VTDDRYKKIMADMGMPNSRSLLQALQQVAHEVEQEVRASIAAPKGEPVAFGFPNSAITGRNRWMMLRERVPADDQYSGALWVPLYAAPQPAA